MPKKGYNVPANLKKPFNAVETQQKFNDVSYTTQTYSYFTQLNKDIQYLRKVLVSWSIFNLHNYLVPNQRTILCNYLNAYHQYTQFDQFDSEFTTLPSLNVNLERIKNVDMIYKSYNIFKKCKWPVRFDSKFVSKISQCSLNQIKYILSFVMLLADGHFNHKANTKQKYGYVKPLTIKSFPYNRFFSLKCFRQKNIIVHIGVQKFPVVNRNNTIKRYEFRSYIQFLDIISDQFVENPKKLQERMKLYFNKIISDVAKKDHSDQIQIDQDKWSKYNTYFFYNSLNPYTNLLQNFQTQFTEQTKTYLPLTFKVYYVSNTQTSTLVFNKQMKRWISQDFLDRQQRKKLNQYQRKINQQMVKRFVDFESAKTLVDLLTKIPNFKVKLTDQQKDVIGENGNVMVIGRSGTGKTTCAVLRLFSIQMLFKIRLSLYKKKFSSQLSNTRCSSNDIDNAMGLHCIFLTASPVLTNQIQRYYKKLTDNIKEELQKKKRRVQQEKKRKQAEQRAIKQQENQDDQKQIKNDTIQQIQQKKVQNSYENIEQEQDQIPDKMERAKSQEVIEQQSQLNKQLKGIKLDQKLQNQDFNQDQQDFDKVKQQFQQKIQKYQSLQDLQQKDYPGFFTVKSYIMMIDGVLPKPFFIRSKGSNSVLDQQSKAAWHNQRKGVMMIQNYYKNQQNQNQQINENAINQIEEQINYSDQEQLQHQYMRQIQLRANKQKQFLTKKLIAKKKASPMSFQVDYDYFATYFWPNVNRRFYSSRNITPQLVWTQIYSTIKGSASSHLYAGQYMPQKVYIAESTNVFLTKQQKLDIYQTFCQYERWKIKNGGYDIMDSVNYILNYIRFRGYNGPQVHYVMIDQVQDLPHAIIYLLSKTATYGVFYSGDTAQTIAKGVGFRFCDLKSLFDNRLTNASLQLKKPIVKHLTVNFRSHNNILQLANSVVSCLQILFPKTIDKLAKQRSNLDGPKPMILAQNDEQLLFYVLCGQQQKNNNGSQNMGMKKPPLQFGCDQVIIVRDQQSKQKVPGMLQHALCLTIYQAKGLEFNDVILFNFFTECKHPQKWNLLKYLKVIDYQMSKQEYQKSVTIHQEQKQTKDPNQQKIEQKQKIEQQVQTQCIVQQKNNVVIVKKIVSEIKKIIKDINDYAQLCSDLKLFYTAITRPRKTLIIYDQDPSCRKIIQKMWENLGIIQIVTKNLIQSQSMTQNSGTSIFKRVVEKTDKTQWKKQGLKMYTRGYFQQAMKCFQKSGNEQLFKKAKANLLADKATKLLIQVQSERNSLKQGFIGYRDLASSDISKLKKKLKHNESKSFVQFYLAAQIFEQLRMYKQSGQCYFSGKKYQKAKQMFLNAKMFKQAAQSEQMLQNYKEAAILYDRVQDYLKVIECLDMINQWQQILKIIKKYEQKMSQIQKTSLLKKYASLALEALVYQIEFQNEQESQNKNKKQNNNRIEVIAQKESDQEEQSSYSDSDLQDQVINEVDPEQMAQKLYKQKQEKIILEQNQSTKKQQNQSSQQNNQEPLLQTIHQKIDQPNQMQQTLYQNLQKIDVNHQASQSFSDLNQSNTQAHMHASNQGETLINQKMLETIKDQDSFSQLNQQIQQNKVQQIKESPEIKHDIQKSQSSFSDLNKSQDFSDINAKYEKQFDPDIQSIRSLADPEDPWIKSAISQINPKSQYSVIDQSQNYNLNVKIIKTKGNIFIQDQIMQKIVRIVSIINQSSTTFLKQFKGYQSLITLNKSQNSQNVIQDNQITDFEDIDSQTINIILDTLQSFKLYKLCLFVCNRYHLPEKAGRYLVSIMLKYSTNCQSNTLISSGLLAPSTQRKSQLEKGILGSIAVHSILENVSSQFLKIKISPNQSENRQKSTLGTYFIQGLILEGFYKKAVFMVNPEQALHILDNFCDFQVFRDVSKKKHINLSQNETYFLQQPPKNQTQIRFSLLSLRDILNKYQVKNRLNMVSIRYYKEFGVHNDINSLKEIVVPQYLPYTKNIFSDSQNLENFLDKYLPQAYKLLTKGNELETADTVIGLLCILHNQNLQHILFKKCQLKSFLQYYRCIKYIKNIITKMDGMNSLNIIRTVLVFYQCKLIQNYKSMSFIGSGYCFLRRTSNMANELIQLQKGNTQTFAYFFEQDFNYIMVRISTIMNLLKKKFNLRLVKFFQNRINQKRFVNKVLPDDYSLHNQQLVLIDALSQASLTLLNKQVKMSKKQITKKVKNTDKKPKFDYKTHGKIQHSYILNDQELSQQENQVKVKYTRDKYVLPDFSKQMTYLSQQLLSIFNIKTKQCKQAAVGKQLYCANLNEYYRQYTQSIGGYNLYDAIEYKRFKRIDMYAENILSVIETLPIIDKHVYTAEILMLLLVEYKRVAQKNDFNLKMSTNYLKFFQGLTPQGQAKNSKTTVNRQHEYQMYETQDLHQNIVINKKKFAFSYNYKYSGDLGTKQIIKLICQYLQIMSYEQNSQFVDFTDILIVFILNITPNSQNNVLYQKLRKLVIQMAPAYKNQVYDDLSKSKKLQDFYQIRQNIIKRDILFHEISIKCTGDIDKSIDQSERDYQIQTKIISGRKKALSKIVSWWKKNKVPLKFKIQRNTLNYFDYALKKQDTSAASQKQYHKHLNDFRMMQKIYDCNLSLNIPLIIKIQKTRQDLLQFYLKNIVTSSLDFHYILITLRKIESLKDHFIGICRELEQGIIERDIKKQLQTMDEQINELQLNIGIWKNDQKWLKQKDINLKRKKVFQVKWMTKSLNQMKIIQKRANLRKQMKLQQKKKFLKG